MHKPNEEQYIGLWQHLREDFAAHPDIMAPGLHAIAVQRFGAWRLRLPKLVRWPVTLVYYALNLFIRNVYGIELTSTTVIGRRLVIMHQSGIVISHNAVIGDDCLIRQNVTIGATPGSRGSPVLGNRVKVGAGAVLVGNITIGDDAQIGPNTVVMMSVPAGATAFAPPAKVMQLRKLKRPPVAANEEAGTPPEQPDEPRSNSCSTVPPG